MKEQKEQLYSEELNSPQKENCESNNEGALTGKKNNKNKSKKHGNDEALNKFVFCLCYLWGILFFVPLIAYKGDSKAKFHANEGLCLFLLTLVINVVLIFIIVHFSGLVSVIFSVILGITNVLILFLGIFGIVGTLLNKNIPLPLIGYIKLIK